jgi:SAM-dependent methyltransferase
MTKQFKRMVWKLYSTLPADTGTVVLKAYYAIRYGGPREVFKSKYLRNAWEDEETVSGPGSTLKYTESIRSTLPELLRKHSIGTFLDAPCGDYNWFRYVAREPGFSYVGGDIVPDLIDRNQALFGTPETRFIELDITKDPLPCADLWMCRDCLFHFSNRDVFRVLANLLQSNIRLFLATTHTDCIKNTDVATGSFRLLNLKLDPFRLGEPIAEIDDWIEGSPKRTIALWRTEDLAAALANNRSFRIICSSFV